MRILRAASALILVGALGALAAVGDQARISGEVAADAVTHTVQIPAGLSTLICPAAPVLPDTVVDVDDEFAQVTDEAITRLETISFPRGTDAAEAVRGTIGETLVPLRAQGSLRTADGENSDEVSVLTVQPVGDEAGLASGTGFWRVDGGDLRSVSAAPCLAPRADIWLVGGSGELGHSSELTLTNPGLTPATVSVELYGPLGPIDAPLLQSIVVAPGRSTEILLEAHAVDVHDLAAHVTATGAEIVATIAHSAIDGITPQGFDVVTPSTAPTTSLVVPALALTDALTEEGAPAPAATADGSAVRIVNPANESARVTLRLLGDEGPIEIPGGADVEISPGAVFEISLSGLPAGDAALLIDSDVAVTAGVVLERGIDARDHTWIPALAPTALATGSVTGADRLVVSAPEAAEVTVRLWNADGMRAGEETLELAAGTSVSVPLRGAAAVELSADTPVLAAAVYEALEGGLLSVLPLTPDANESHTVAIRLVN